MQRNGFRGSSSPRRPVSGTECDHYSPARGAFPDPGGRPFDSAETGASTSALLVLRDVGDRKRLESALEDAIRRAAPLESPESQEAPAPVVVAEPAPDTRVLRDLETDLHHLADRARTTFDELGTLLRDAAAQHDAIFTRQVEAYERVKAEQLEQWRSYESFVQAAASGVIRVSPDDTVHAVNPALASMLDEANVGAVFTTRALADRLPRREQAVVYLDDSPRTATVWLRGAETVHDLGSHFGLDLEGEEDDGRDEEWIIGNLGASAPHRREVQGRHRQDVRGRGRVALGGETGDSLGKKEEGRVALERQVFHLSAAATAAAAYQKSRGAWLNEPVPAALPARSSFPQHPQA